MNLTQKLIQSHLASGTMTPGEEIALRIDQTLSQDATGTLSYLQFEAIGVPRVRTQLSVSYVDHNMLQGDFRNADDHVYLQDVAAKYGLYYSRPGNGICHQVHLERFAIPGTTLLGTDSHTPTCGGMGVLAIGAGGLDVAIAMAGSPYHLRMPQVLGVELHGHLQPGVTAKDIIFEILRRLTVKGGVGKVLEYYGPGAANLDVPERSTITNMGAELGATTSLFPSDARTMAYLTRQQRAHDFREQAPDPGATYDEHMRIDLDTLEPLIARPDSPDNVCPISAVSGTPVNQVAIGSCTNSSYSDLMTVAAMLKGKTVHPNVSLVVTPGSRQVLHMIARNGALADLIAAGARILESACGPCAGMGQVPSFNAVSVRSFNRNFPGRSGGIDNRVYLASPTACAAAALAGEIADPRAFATAYIGLPETYLVDDSGIFPPAAHPETIAIRRGPNIKPLPTRADLEAALSGGVLLKLNDNISTDHILPAGPQVLPLRSNVPAIAEYLFRYVDPTFIDRVKDRQGGFIVAGQNYGQGSSREHAALCPMFFGVKAILAKSFARIHRDNLINYAVLPLAFVDAQDYDRLDPDDELEITELRERLEDGATRIPVYNRTKQTTFETSLELTTRERHIVL
ncbi:MAG: aconitate hydratase, partial [Candidatus Tectomicrobia bacterium]|nr:aconitate hydratase [Candidatus Tectomicrobia bacterium]